MGIACAEEEKMDDDEENHVDVHLLLLCAGDPHHSPLAGFVHQSECLLEGPEEAQLSASALQFLTDDVLLPDVGVLHPAGLLPFIGAVGLLFVGPFVLSQNRCLLLAGAGHLLEDVEGPIHLPRNHRVHASVPLEQIGEFRGAAVQEGLQEEEAAVIVVAAALHLPLKLTDWSRKSSTQAKVSRVE